MAVFIYGPMATGKTFNAEHFRKHYRCLRTVDDWPHVVRGGIQPTDLVLTNLSLAELQTKLRKSGPYDDRFNRLIAIDDARRDAGLGSLPAKGAFL